MDKHINLLNSTCRLCCGKIKFKRRYLNPKSAKDYTKEISAVFDYDITKEDNNINPPFLCDCCRRKLDRCKLLNYNLIKTSIAEFVPHNNENCLCVQRLKKHIYFCKSNNDLEITTDNQIEKSVKLNENLLMTKSLLDNTANSYSMQLLAPTTDDNAIYSQYGIECDKNIEIKVHIMGDYTWKIFAYSKEIKSDNQILKDIPMVITTINIDLFFHFISKLSVCKGNQGFQPLIEQKLCKGTQVNFCDKDGIVTATIQNQCLESVENFQTIRSTKCHLVVLHPDYRCSDCNKHRLNLNTSMSRLCKKDDENLKKTMRNDLLSRSQLEEKVKNYQRERRSLTQQVKQLEKRIERFIADDSFKIDKESSTLFKNVIADNNSEFPDDSPQYLLWEQQKKLAKLSKSSSMKWHPVMIRWCLSIYLKSPGTYEHLRRGGFLKLPHRTTLNQYTGFTEIGTGFNPDILEQFIKEIDFDNMEEYQKNITIIFDEMKIKSNLVFSRNSGKLIGFTELGSINEELAAFGESVISEKKPKDLATHVLSFMARGLSKRFNYPIGYFASVGFDSDQLYPCVWEAIENMESLGLKVRALTCDGASPNRRFFKIHQLFDDENVSEDGVVFWTHNRFDSSRKIYFFSDPPHLVKTLRNNLENSHGNRNTRNLIINGEQLSWQHMINVYEWDLGMNRFSPGLRKMPKLKEEHINLSPRLRMRVNLAAQILSKTAAEGLKSQGLAHTKATETFLRHTNQFFDILNVSQTFTGIMQRNKAMQPFRSPDDWRFEWLLNVFLKYINDWKNEADSIPGFAKDYKNRLCISHQTINGLRITVHSFVNLVPLLLREEGFTYLLSSKLNQDPLEEHFSKQRMRGGGVDNPTLEQYGYNERKIILAKSDMITSVRGNTRGRVRDNEKIDINDTRQLPKRPKKEKK